MLKWDDSLSLGITRIDDQHRKMVDLANGVLEAIRRKQGQAVIRPLVQELREYTVTHFQDEEAFMERIRYPEIAEHRQEHMVLTQRVKDYQRAIYHREDIEVKEMLDFLKEWLVGHIIESDMRIARYLDTNEAMIKAAGRA
jgi:hemerythrin-like metal-binding protein